MIPPRAIVKKATALQRAVFCFLIGAASCISMAPDNIWPVLIITLSLFYILILESGSPKAALSYGWLFGFGYFVCGLFWVKNALLVEGNDFSWVWPLAVAGLPALLASFFAVAMYLARRFANLETIAGFLMFTAFLALLEWMRGFVFTGYPWNLFGYTWAGIQPMIQVVSISNVYFLTWLTIFWMTLPGFLLITNAKKNQKILLSSAAILSILACLGFGFWRLSTATTDIVPDIQIKVVQPNIPQSEKWDRKKVAANFIKMVNLSAPKEQTNDKTIIVWPETAVSFWVLSDPQAIGMITGMLRSYQGPAELLTGYLRFDSETSTYYNSLVKIDADGTISNIYDKHHLVPFGEFIPFQKWIPLVPVVKFTGFGRGTGPTTFEVLGIKYSPVVCYEIIFPGAVSGQELPDLIVNITNDAWYGVSAGPYQHFTQAIFRAVEEGIPVVRSANTGISGMIDPLGNVHEVSGLYQEYEKKLALPARNMVFRNHAPLKNIIFLLMVLGAVSFGIIQNKKR